MKFEIFQSKNNNKYYFNLKARNGRIILASQGYSSIDNCNNGIKSVKKNSGNTDRFTRKKSPKSLHSFHLLALNSKTIGHSQTYTTKAAMEKGIRSVMTNAPLATVDDLTQNDQ